MEIVQIKNEAEDKSITLGMLIDSWLLYKKHKLKESTFYRYQYITNKYIMPEFAETNVVNLLEYDFNLFIDKLIQELSVKTVRDIIVVVKSILKYTERKQDLDFKLDLISIPKCETEDIDILNKKEQKKLVEMCCNNPTFRNIGILICLYTGIRIGELCALKWEDIDLKHDILRINKTMQRVYRNKKDTIIIIGSPKSKKSIREIPICKKLHNILKELNDANQFKGDEFFLSGTVDKFIEPRNYQYMFKKLLADCNIKDYKFHILRHTFATNCIEIGMDIKSLSELLGHSNVDITLNRYVHSSFKTKRYYIEKL